MIPDIFKTTNLLQKGLDAAQLRQDVISNNIANIDTPGFKASEVQFESYMKEALADDSGFQAKVTRPEHIEFGGGSAPAVQPTVVSDDSAAMRMDGNGVDIDKQMTDLAKNSIWYDALVAKLNGELSRLKTAIDGR
jgi:flagellar basal-body rod protein FlgB